MKYFLFVTSLLYFGTVTASSQQAAYRFKIGQPYKYIIEVKQDVIQQAMGQNSTISVDGTCALNITSEEAYEDGSSRVSMKIENTLFMIESPQGTQTYGNELSGKSFGFRLKPDGLVSDRDESLKNLSPQQAQIIPEIIQFLPRLDPAKLTVGSTWTTTSTDTTVQSGVNIKTVTAGTYTVKGTAPCKTRECLRIEFTIEIKTSGSQSRMGQEYVILGTNSRKGQILYDASEGILIEATSLDSGDTVVTSPSDPSIRMNTTNGGNSKVEFIP